MARTRFDTRSLPALEGRTVVVTGANSGIGLEACRILSGAGADVVMACRNEAKAHAAIDDVRRDLPGARLEFLALDLADLDSVHRFAEQLLARRPRIDVLVNNAGVMAIPRRTTKQGFEMQLGTNHLGHFALTGLLLPRLLQQPGARVVSVSSTAHHTGRIDFDDLMGERRYRKWTAYCQSKLANLLFAFELDRRAQAAGRSLLSCACHPGYADTNLQLVGSRMRGDRFAERSIALFNRLFAQAPEMGALPAIYAAVAPDASSGDYFGPDGLGGGWGYPRRTHPSKRARDAEVARRLWESSSELTGVTYAF